VTESQKELTVNAPKLPKLWREKAQRDWGAVVRACGQNATRPIAQNVEADWWAENNAVSLVRTAIFVRQSCVGTQNA